jgi:hypothetical protein
MVLWPIYYLCFFDVWLLNTHSDNNTFSDERSNTNVLWDCINLEHMSSQDCINLEHMNSQDCINLEHMSSKALTCSGRISSS